MFILLIIIKEGNEEVKKEKKKEIKMCSRNYRGSVKSPCDF